ncbi:RNA polymerase sigma-70 factor [Desertivirga brevis]|uniref:RNA polymerase sigma-70 factor n=1 Tax=Desertivirga brevis TaxID=2810310 RepID=UPI001A970FDC|nr:RNA polymerase sigma-70 factor [Pedobacter sp. SYSU D00873]
MKDSKLKLIWNDQDQLKLSISQGNQSAFEQLYLQYNKKITSFATYLLKSKELAEEVVEDVFVKLWCRRETVTEIKDLKLFLYTSTKNLCLNTLAKNSNKIVSSSIELLDLDFYSQESPQEAIIASELMKNMQQAIDALPARCKLIFKLIREDGLKYKEVAEILGISVNTIDNQMAIAVKRICSALKIRKEDVL